MFDGLQVPAMSPLGNGPQEPQTSDPQVTESTRLLARHDEPTMGEVLLYCWDFLQKPYRVELVERMSRGQLATLAMALGRRELAKLGCAEAV